MPVLAPAIIAPPPPPPPPAPRVGLSMTWTGADGSVWPLTEASGGLFITNGGLRGLHMPQITRYTSTSPALPGSRWRGSRTEERECFWPLFVYHDGSSQNWAARDRAFWATMDPGAPGVWTVMTPSGGTRTLTCRFAETDDGYTNDPLMRGWNLYGITLIAEQPYWESDLVTRTFRSAEPVPFYGGSGGTGHAPPFAISSGSSLAMANITNPGDLPADPIYVLDGPWDAGASVGVDTSLTVYGAAIPDGQSLVVDHRPGSLSIKQVPTPTAEPGTRDWLEQVTGEGTDQFASATQMVPTQIKPGAEVAIAISAVGSGSVHVALQPLHWRAW